MLQELKLADAPLIMQILLPASLGAPSWSEAMLKAEIESSISLAARSNSGEVEGFILLRSVVDALEISYLATAPAARKKGIMQALLARAAELAKAQKMAIWLEVHEQNEAARRLYEKFGFTQVGKRPYYYSDRGTAILYNLAFAVGI